MLKTKSFVSERTSWDLENEINIFIEKNNIVNLIDIKYSFCLNSYNAPVFSALLIYIYEEN